MVAVLPALTQLFPPYFPFPSRSFSPDALSQQNGYVQWFRVCASLSFLYASDVFLSCSQLSGPGGK